MTRAVDLEAARRSFLFGGAGTIPRDIVRAEVLASWERSRRHDVDPDRIATRFVRHEQSSPLLLAAAEDAFDDFFKLAGKVAACVVLVDADGTVRVRRDGDEGLVPGYSHGEAAVGTSAASVALHERSDFVVSGAEHYHSA